MKDHIGGGLVGVPVITRWAVRSHNPEFIYRMLKQRGYPGYLHMIDHGATATWEYWSGERSRVHNCYNGIGTWFYQALGGLRTDSSHPGYEHVFIDPQIPEGVEWCRIGKETPYGRIDLGWEIADGELRIDVTLPPGVTATAITPAGACRGRRPQAGPAIARDEDRKRPPPAGLRPRPAKRKAMTEKATHGRKPADDTKNRHRPINES